MNAQGDAERESGEETDDVSDIGDVRVVAGYAAFFVNNDEVVDEVDNRDQSLRREEEPGELERPHEHHAPCQSENRRRGSEHSGSAGQEDWAEDEACKSAREKDHHELARANGIFQCVSENEEKEHVADQVEDVGVNKQRCDQRPNPALFEIIQTEDEIVLGERRLLLPRPEARRDASEYQQ